MNKRYKLKRSSSGAGRQPKLVIPITAVPCNAAGTQPEDIIPNHVEKRKEEQKAPEKSVRAVPRETLEDAARVAAHAVAVAERVNDRTIRACEKVKTLVKILDESSVMLALAKELHTICKLPYVTITSKGFDIYAVDKKFIKNSYFYPPLSF